MASTELTEARRTKNDEFYTQYRDIETEVYGYLEYAPDTFRGKTVLLPCDDPEWSNFTKFFAQNFENLGLKKLISTSYAPRSKKMQMHPGVLPFEEFAPQYDPAKTQTRGKIYVVDRDITGDGRINIDDIHWGYLEGDGDFRSPQVRALRDEADIIVTNPPFSLFREFLAWIVEADKKFLIIGNINAIAYKEVFPLIMKNKIWTGLRFSRRVNGKLMSFAVPPDYIPTKGIEIYRDPDTGQRLAGLGSVGWFTNLEHGRRHKPLGLMTMEQNLRFSRHKELQGLKAYPRYDNYDAIEVPYTDAIPSDYPGAMGVPISFLDKYCPEQFEILGIMDRQGSSNLRTKKYTLTDSPKYNDLNARGVIKTDGKYIPMYARIIIRHKDL